MGKRLREIGRRGKKGKREYHREKETHSGDTRNLAREIKGSIRLKRKIQDGIRIKSEEKI